MKENNNKDLNTHKDLATFTLSVSLPTFWAPDFQTQLVALYEISSVSTRGEMGHSGWDSQPLPRKANGDCWRGENTIKPTAGHRFLTWGFWHRRGICSTGTWCNFGSRQMGSVLSVWHSLLGAAIHKAEPRYQVGWMFQDQFNTKSNRLA